MACGLIVSDTFDTEGSRARIADEALLAFDAAPLLPRLRCRTLIIASGDDLLVPPVCSEQLHAALHGQELHAALRRIDANRALVANR